ncbi:MAG: RecX family transcriptional regulator [Chitinophagaceae bacterium]|nr:MAG: RecX family transcriptional regulator [Chitinophagaceae bacterium]
MTNQNKRLTPQQALARSKEYCKYQERCHSEVRDRLFSFGLAPNDVEQIVSQLIEEDYLNEQRFAEAFARGKFRMKHWGRVKIRYEMKQKRITEYCIKKGMKEIDEDEYLATLTKLMEEKLRTLKSEKNVFIRKRKLTDYLVQKGYERDIISSLMNAETK